MPDIHQAQDILKSLGLPAAQQNEISALTLLALVGLGPTDPWSAATRSRRSVSKDIMAFIAERFGKHYAPNTRETVRRQVLHQFVQARIADYNPFEQDLPTNSPRAHYAITDDALSAIKTYGTKAWADAVAQFIATHGSLSNTYAKHRSTGKLVPITLPDGSTIELSPGKHNDVQKAIIEQFAPRFAPDSKLLYIGDTAKKNVIMDAKTLADFGLGADDHDKLPDVVLLDQKKNWLFLIEAVTSHGPMSPKRVFELEERLKGSQAGPVYVSAFPDMAEFRKHMKDIAWESEVWIAETPDHMIHFNGDRFLGPRK
ncbi:restriction endonuclease [Haematospirillum jordaniae]|uniref:Restriction endonuclease n=1 Tax=Haematospirillum jordaniae TaxID=1549855 RepID=A0A143DGX5_9PROT|nr:BsuBI/PstI family type II restriction endonuclease [Haematospirillum jordaniae]AMW35761.1 restriction endonuclease [Haematospirillum jordaniae]AMW35955.1 restriction endonuclease [Haematospirillum jordaniae]NKD46229.1 restriction endonuclease [Haematospirillum jordaniae]NKD58128.1 restriction endonuclease [Haematospirillum jordaniae]NKD60237.1 restriction endonuclease [Haematospirillum jordaniae]